MSQVTDRIEAYTAKPKPKRKHECGICGRWNTAENMVFSRHTRRYYCSEKDMKACRKRAARRKTDRLGDWS